MSTVYTNETNLSFWLRLCRAVLFVAFVVKSAFSFLGCGSTAPRLCGEYSFEVRKS
jgi:hypothetical protein